jgi:hypothetical protein
MSPAICAQTSNPWITTRFAARRSKPARPARRRTDQARSIADLRLQLANGTIDFTVSGEYHRQEAPTLHGT